MKKVIKINGNRRNHFAGDVEIRDLEDFLEEMKKLTFTHVNISYDDGYNEIGFIPYYNRFETDEEYERRITVEQIFSKEIEEVELKELERLKLKYEK